MGAGMRKTPLPYDVQLELTNPPPSALAKLHGFPSSIFLEEMGSHSHAFALLLSTRVSLHPAFQAPSSLCFRILCPPPMSLALSPTLIWDC